MKNIYFSIFYIHYRCIQLGRSGKLWSAISSSILMAFTLTLCLHFIIGDIFGNYYMIVYNSTLYGNIFLFLLTIFNLFLFLNNSNYLAIEERFENNKRKFKQAIIIAFIYFTLIVLVFIFL
jgi:hypothetical protein